MSRRARVLWATHYNKPGCALFWYSATSRLLNFFHSFFFTPTWLLGCERIQIWSARAATAGAFTTFWRISDHIRVMYSHAVSSAARYCPSIYTRRALCQISKEAAGRNAFISLSPAIKVCFRARTANFSLSSFLICANTLHPQRVCSASKVRWEAETAPCKGGGWICNWLYASAYYVK